MILLDELVKYLLRNVLVKGYYGDVLLKVEDGQITRMEKKESIVHLS